MLLKLVGKFGIATLAAMAGFIAHAQAPSGTQSLDQMLGTMQLPPMRTLTLTLQPPPSLDSLLGTMQLPAMRSLTLTLQPPLSLDQLLGTMQVPPMRSLTLTVQPSVSQSIEPPPASNLAQPATALDQLLGTMQLPAMRTLTLTLQPPPTLDSLLGTMQVPAMRSLTLTLQPPPALDQLLGTMQLPAMRSLTLTVQPPPGQVAPGFKPPALAVAEPAPTATDPAVLALIAAANFPVPQPLSVVLVPPPSPYAVIANANFPAPQPLSVVLIPPPSPYAPIASANFPAPQPLSVVLVPGAAQPETTLIAGFAPRIFTVDDFSVQIVQAIPRQGANFFDWRDPTGLNTLVKAPVTTTTTVVTTGGGGGGGGGSVAVCPPGATIGPDVRISRFGNTSLVNQGSGSIRLTPVGTDQIRFEFAFPATNQLGAGSLGNVVPIVFTPNPAGDTVFITAASNSNNGVIQFARSGANVCAKTLSFTQNGI